MKDNLYIVAIYSATAMVTDRSLRTLVMPDGQVGFVGNEVAKVLGYSNYRNAIANHVDDEDKLRTKIEYAGQKREVTIINESGLYSLILTSKLPQAREFKHWVTNDVLPKIRQTEAYMTHDTMMQMMRLNRWGCSAASKALQAFVRTGESISVISVSVIFSDFTCFNGGEVGDREQKANVMACPYPLLRCLLRYR